MEVRCAAVAAGRACISDCFASDRPLRHRDKGLSDQLRPEPHLHHGAGVTLSRGDSDSVRAALRGRDSMRKLMPVLRLLARIEFAFQTSLLN